MVLDTAKNSVLFIRLKRHQAYAACARMLWFGILIASPAVADKPLKSEKPLVEEKTVTPTPTSPIYKEITSPDPSDQLFDPAGWDEREETQSIRIRSHSSRNGEYEVPDGCTVSDVEPQDLHTLDMLHHRFSKGLCAPTVWLDNVFGDPLEEVQQQAETTLRIVSSQQFEEGGTYRDSLAFKARIKMPNFEKRWSLMLESERDFDDAGISFASGTDSAEGRSRSLTAALQWARQRSNGMELKARVGFYSGLKGHVKLSARRQRDINDRWLWRLTETVDWRDEKGWRSKTTLDFDRPIGPVRLFRATSLYEHSKELHREGRGERWRQMAMVASQLNKRVAMRYLVSVEGYTQPQNRVDSYRAAVTYRRNTWRPWFYVEIEPYLLWSREYHYETLVGVVFRLETLFGDY